MTTIIIRIIIVTIIITTIMALSCNHGYHWRDGCPELNYVYLYLHWGLIYMFRKCNKAHRHIILILQNIEHRDLIAIFFGPPYGGCDSLRWFIHFYLRKKIESKIPWKEFGLLLFNYCLKNGSNFPMNMSVKHVRWSIQIEKIGSAYIYIHISYVYYTYHIHITLVVPSRQCLFTYCYCVFA